MPTPRVIDLHNHIATPACQQLVEGLASPLTDPFSFYAGEETRAYNAAHFAAIVPQLTDPARRLEDMERMGVDLQVLSVAPPQYYYWADPALGRRLARLQNEHLAGIVAHHPDRFAGLATVPLQDVDGAVAELDHAVRHLGLRGVEICTNVNGLDLDDRRFRPFFAAACELDVLVLLHPQGFTQAERLMDYYLTNVIGNPLESTIAVTRMIHGGSSRRTRRSSCASSTAAATCRSTPPAWTTPGAGGRKGATTSPTGRPATTCAGSTSTAWSTTRLTSAS